MNMKPDELIKSIVAGVGALIDTRNKTLEINLDAKMKALESNLRGEIKASEERLTKRIDTRIEGHEQRITRLEEAQEIIKSKN